jgi:hypothetical protein
MSTLTALKLERELEITRRATAERPTLAMQWTIDPRSGRPVGTWVATPVVASEPQSVLTEPELV